MLTSLDKLLLVCMSLFFISTAAYVKSSIGEDGHGLAWVKDYPVEFVLIISVAILNLSLVCFMFRKNRKKSR
jgi:hypothetical protein